MSKTQNDAQKIAGLASILQSTNKPKEIDPSPAPSAAAVIETPVRTSAKRHKRERVGKKSDPHFHLYGLYLRKETEKRSRRRLEDTLPDKDLSDLVQELLEQWLTKR